ncbi:MAG: hypothetical protein KF812_06705 [Fimbriimonadaceae bacterium]|nr:hypothetical protein [Fimbriimonadaceae bacterium]
MRYVALVMFAGIGGVANAYSFAGNDWTFSMDAVLSVRTAVLNEDVTLMSNDPVDVSQPDLNHFSFPYSIGPVTGQGDFVVTGDIVSDVNTGKTTDPFVYSGLTLRATYPTFTLSGVVDGAGPSNEAFGPRAWHITGDPVTVSNIQVEVLLAGNWVNLGSNSFATVNDWEMTRAVPEPATFVTLGALALAGLRRKSTS